MSNIVIAFPKEQFAQKIRRILSQSGHPVTAVCTTGAAALSKMQELENGILVCGYRFVDMIYTDIYEARPAGFQMLLVASASYVLEHQEENLVCLFAPLKVHELLHTVEMMEYTLERRRIRRRRSGERTKEEQQELDRAKEILQERNGLSEQEAHRYIQKRSMENGVGLVETAQMIISLMGDT